MGLRRRSSMWEDVYEDFRELTKSEQLALFNAMKEDLFLEEADKITKALVKPDLLLGCLN